ncbi:MAG: hypothetical protein SNJ56_05775 [Termitinemataceae bacterium]
MNRYTLYWNTRRTSVKKFRWASLLAFVWLCAGPGLIGPGHLAAQTSTIITDEDALFGEDAPDTLDPQLSSGTGNTSSAPAGSAGTGAGSTLGSTSGSATAAFLKRDQVRIGGSFSGNLKTSFTWTNPWEGNGKLLDPDNSRLDPTIASTLFFDARPEEDFRVYGSVKTAWPFTSTSTFLTSAQYIGSPSPQVVTTQESLTTLNLQVFELFADFSWKDAAFFRFGKHTVKWGVGYFFSPADVLNLTSIDVTDPTAQREGPISLRAHIPVPGTQNNFWGYILLPGSAATGDTNQINSTSGTGSQRAVFKPEDAGYAGKAEFLIGNYEIGLGGLYQKDKAPRFMATATGSLGRFDMFAEAVASWGNDRLYVTSITPFTTESRDDRWYFQGTAGFLYTARDGYTTLAAQYYYNGEGYGYEERKDLVAQFRNLPSSLQESLAATVAGTLYGASQHYGAISLSRSQLFVKDLSASILVMANLADLSGFVTPSIQYRLFSYVSLSISPTFVWYMDGLWGTGKDSEYVLLNRGPAISISLSASLGSGRF